MAPLISKILRLSIGFKLSITFLAVILCVSLPLSYLIIKYSEDLLRKQIEESILKGVEAEEGNLRTAIINGDYWQIFKRVEAWSNFKGIEYVAILDPQGFVLAHSKPQSFPIYTYYFPQEGEVSVDIKSFNIIIGRVVFKVDNKYVENSLMPIKLFSAGFTSLFATFGFMLGLSISLRIYGRLKRILKMATDAEKGKVYPVSFIEKDEIQEFANHLYQSFKNIERLLENARFEGSFFSNLINSLGEMIFVLDTEGRIIFANSVISHFHYRYKDLIGRRFIILVCDPKVRSKLRSAMALRESVILDCYFRGRSRKVNVLLNFMWKGEFYLVTMRDISELKEMEKRVRLMENLSLLGEMSVGLAHELKNALLPIRLLADVEEWDEEDINVVKQSLVRVDRVLINMLNFARQDKEVKSQFSVGELVRGIHNLFEPLLKEKGINFIIDIQEDISLFMERGYLELILVNLLKNAVDAVKVGGNVGLESKVKGNMLVFCVWDDGPGIDEDLKNKVFEPFFTTKKGGTGLGLSIALRYTYMLKGYLTFESKKGYGTRFYLEVPLNG